MRIASILKSAAAAALLLATAGIGQEYDSPLRVRNPLGLPGPSVLDFATIDAGKSLRWLRYDHGKHVLAEQRLPFKRGLLLRCVESGILVACGTDPTGQLVICVLRMITTAPTTGNFEILLTDIVPRRVGSVAWSPSRLRLYALDIDSRELFSVDVASTPTVGLSLSPPIRLFGAELAAELMSAPAYLLRVRAEEDRALETVTIDHTSSMSSPLVCYERLAESWRAVPISSFAEDPQVPSWRLGGIEHPLSTMRLPVSGPEGRFEVVLVGEEEVVANGYSDGSSWQTVSPLRSLDIGSRCYVRGERGNQSLPRTLPLRIGTQEQTPGFQIKSIEAKVSLLGSGKKVAIIGLEASRTDGSRLVGYDWLVLYSASSDAASLPLRTAENLIPLIRPDGFVRGYSIAYGRSSVRSGVLIDLTVPQGFTQGVVGFQALLLPANGIAPVAITDLIVLPLQ